jgi:hypothetical protein
LKAVAPLSNLLESRRFTSLAVAMLTHKSDAPVRESFSDYVAELQLHMSLQARNLVPSSGQAEENRDRLLRETQETVEKMLSRQLG